MKKAMALALAMCLTFTFVSCSQTKPADNDATTPEVTEQAEDKAEEVEETSPGNVDGVSGTFEGEGNGHSGKIVVDVVLQDGVISDIIIKEQHETAGLGDAAIETLRQNMINTNSTGVDVVTGATIASNGFIEAVENALKNAGIDKDALVSQEDVSQSIQREDSYTADVVVIGAGGAGMAAAIEAATSGANVIIVEKMPAPGGNTLLSGAEMAAPKNWVQQASGITDSPDLMYEDTLVGGDNENNPELVRVLADNALEGATWLKDEIGVTFEDYQLFFGGHSVERSLVPLNASGVEPVTKLLAKLDELQVPIHLDTKATELIKNDQGRVVAVKATFGDKEITYNANKAVIIASGGFGANVEMRKKYNSDMDEKILSTNSVGSQGDGMVMAEAAGAELVDMPFIQTYPTCDVDSGTLLYVGDVRLIGRAILVNKEGNRFVEELERRDVISKATVEQTGGVSYLFWDEPSMIESTVGVKHEQEYNSLIERKKLVKADTIEEAAAFFEIDPQALIATVDKYNKYAADGKDLDFNKRGTLTPFTEGPYYIMVSTPAVHHTMGGIKINTNAQVTDAEGAPISGLYAAGEVTGDIHGTNRLGSNAIADIIVFGRIAGKNAAAEEPIA